MSFSSKRIVVGVGGGIAAFKAVLLVRALLQQKAEVRVVMTRSATRFVGPTTFSGLTGKPTVVNLWSPAYPGEVHVELGEWADAMVIAPATANLLARAAHGLADDAVLATLACARGPIVFAPAMHERMWLGAATQRNVLQLRADGASFAGPLRGPLASGQTGWGRMAEPDAIVQALSLALANMRSTQPAVAESAGMERDLRAKTVLISAGPTLEDIDPVRFISNRSSGRMGFALAAAARDRGAHVILVSGPTAVAPPEGVETTQVRSARDMQAAIEREVVRADVVVMTAAVADYRPAQVAGTKIKKKGETMSIELVKNPDILAELGARRRGKRPVLVGFAMETNDVTAHAKKKLRAKRCDLIVANEAAVGFGGDDNQATLVGPSGNEPLPKMKKLELAHRILDRVAALLVGDRAGGFTGRGKRRKGKRGGR